MNISRMTVDLPEDFKNEIKSHAALLGIKLKDYVIQALETKINLDEKLENEHLAKLADKAKKEGFIGTSNSKVLLNKMKNS
jgi:hypothetical protein